MNQILWLKHSLLSGSPLISSSLRITRPFGQTVGLACIILCLLGGIAESIARSEALQTTLIQPKMGTRHSQLGPKLSRLNAIQAEEGHIDCLVIGSSIVNLNFDPQAFADAYQRTTGQTGRCFNFGIDALTAPSAAALIQILVEDYQPRLLIYSTDARDYAVPREAFDNEVLLESSWIQYRLGHFTLDGWLTEHVYLYRYRQQLHHLSRFNNEAALLSHSEINFELTAEGYLPEEEVSLYVKDAPDLADDSFEVTYYSDLLSPYEMLGGNLAALEQITDHNGPDTQIVLLEMPLPQGFYHFFGNGKEDYQHFLNEVGQVAQEGHIPFWQTNPLQMIPDTGWSDYNHLNTQGAVVLSEWLGQQVGQAVNQGSLSLSDPKS